MILVEIDELFVLNWKQNPVDDKLVTPIEYTLSVVSGVNKIVVGVVVKGDENETHPVIPIFVDEPFLYVFDKPVNGPDKPTGPVGPVKPLGPVGPVGPNGPTE